MHIQVAGEVQLRLVKFLLNSQCNRLFYFRKMGEVAAGPLQHFQNLAHVYSGQLILYVPSPNRVGNGY